MCTRRFGACGYLWKTCSEDQMIEAIQTVHAGGHYLPQEIAARFSERLPGGQLSARQSDILQHIAEGLSDREVATQMGIRLADVWKELSGAIDLLTAATTERGDDARGR